MRKDRIVFDYESYAGIYKIMDYGLGWSILGLGF
jgi:hypothetical protein